MDNNLCTDMLQICRICMKEIIETSFFYLDCTPTANTQLTIRQILYSSIPEVDLSIVSDPVMCSNCVDNLLSVFEFKKTCLQSEIQINKYIQQVEHTGDLNLVKVVQFHQPDVKNLDVEVKMEGLEITEEYVVCDASAFKEGSECTEPFHQPDVKNLDIEVKMEDLEIREDFKNEDLVCETSEFNEASESTESTELKYLLELQMVDMQDVLFNTFDDYNINYNLSAAAENSSTHNRNIAQNGLREVIEHQDHNYSKNLNKTNVYYQCYKCGHQAESKLKLILHLKHHTRKKNEEPNMRADIVEKLLKCSICEYQSNFKVNLKQHMQIHTGEKLFACSVCEYQCSLKSSLKTHMQNHTGDQPFSCSVCKYKCSYKSNFKRHMRIHTGEKPFSCSVCEYQCCNKSSIKQHMIIHTREKPFSCSVCEYQCSQKSHLKEHMRIHTGEKPFSCSICEYQCRHKGNLKRHIMQNHTGEKPFLCCVCKYQCTHKYDLKKHMLIHTGEKPFSCSVCEHQCRQKSQLNKHMQIHTREKQLI